METTPAHSPLIIEVAINGSRQKADNPHVPLSDDEIVDTVDACVQAGASLVHLHAGDPVVGGAGAHSAGAYLRVLRRIRARHPRLQCYPTLPGGGTLPMARRLAHVVTLRDEALLEIAPIDPGSMNYGGLGADGSPPQGARLYQTTFDDVREGFALLRDRGMGCTMSLFEPGFLRLVLAHHAAGSLPRAAIVKFEFTTGRRLLFGLPPTEAGLAAWCAALGEAPIPWMVALREGDVAGTLAPLAIARGGHVRVGLEDFAGDARPRNEELVARVARLAEAAGRRPATVEQCTALLGLS